MTGADALADRHAEHGVGSGAGLVRVLGFASAVAATIASVGFDLAVFVGLATRPPTPWTGIEDFAASYDATSMSLPVVPSILLAFSFVILAASVQSLALEGQQLFGRLAVAFAVPYLVIVGLNYMLQLTFVRANLLDGNLVGLDRFVMGNPHSLFWTLVVLGYGLQSLAGLFAGLVLAGGGRARRTIRWALAINALLNGIAAVVYVVTIDPYHPAVFASLGFWAVGFPLATALMALIFWRARLEAGR